MPIVYCSKCNKPIPDSFHNFKEECECQDWIRHAKKRKFMIRSKGKLYDFTED